MDAAQGAAAAGKASVANATGAEVKAREKVHDLVVEIRDDVKLGYPDDKKIANAFGAGTKLGKLVTDPLLAAANAVIGAYESEDDDLAKRAKAAGVTAARINQLKKARDALSGGGRGPGREHRQAQEHQRRQADPARRGDEGRRPHPQGRRRALPQGSEGARRLRERRRPPRPEEARPKAPAPHAALATDRLTSAGPRAASAPSAARPAAASEAHAPRWPESDLQDAGSDF